MGIMRENVEAYAPARVCFGGESLDWMKNGPSIVGAIDLKTKASVEELPTIGENYIIFIDSKSPIPTQKLRFWSEASWYTDPYLRYVESAVHLIQQGVREPYSLAVDIVSNIPAKAGVSSSAAVILATIAAVGEFFGLEQSIGDICEKAYEVENSKLRTGAGRMDFYACGVGGLLYLNCGKSPTYLEPYKFPKDLGILLVDTLTPHETKSFISSKRERFQDGDKGIIYYADQAELMVEQFRNLMSKFVDNKEEIGGLITRFHNLLRDNVNCSTSLLDACVEKAISYGALGAKLTGSGMGGCMFALVDLENMEKVELALNQLPVRVYPTTVIENGVVIFKSNKRLNSAN